MSTRSASNIIWQSICLILLVSSYTHASQDSPPDCSCKCQQDNQVIEKDPSVPSTLCENENFIKCCSASEPSSIPIETSTNLPIQDTSSAIPEGRMQFEIDLISRVMQKIFSMVRPSTEESANKSKNTNEEEEVQDTPMVPIEAEVGKKILKDEEDIVSFIDHNKDASLSSSSEQRMKEPKSFPLMGEPHAIRVRILNNHLPLKMTGLPVGFSLPGRMGAAAQRIHHQREDKGALPMITNDDETRTTIEHQDPPDDIQKLIDETSSFESRKVLPKIHPGIQDLRWRILRKRNNFQPTTESPKASNEEEERVPTKLIGCFESEKGGSSYAVSEHESPKEDSDASSMRTPKKVADLFRQKTSLETLLALDRASVQATDGNTPNSAGKGNSSEDSDTSQNFPRLGRSRLTTAENKLELQHPIEHNSRSDNNDQADTLSATPVSRFKRPPRVLPKRIQAQNSATASNKYRNSRERTLDLFNRSAESKSRASLIIKRRERKKSRFSGSANPETENDSSLKKTDEADEIVANQTKSVSNGGDGDRKELE